MKILVVGATGTLGRQIVRHAIDKDYQVRCLVRNNAKASFLKEWGAELVKGDICKPQTLISALEGVDIIIDAATARATDSLRIKDVDWQGKVNLIQAAKKANIKRYIFFSILNAEDFESVPLMEIKHCTELFLQESGVNYTILKLAGFMQGLIAQYGIPILDNQPVWVSGENTPIAYMNSQDIAKFAIKAIEIPETVNSSYPVVGTRPWTGEQIIQLCERLSGKQAKISRIPISLLRFLRGFTRWFKWTLNTSDRLAFAEVLASGKPLDASMEEVYKTFNLDPQDTTTLEDYLQEYFDRIMKKIKEIDYEKNKTKKRKKNSFFK
ncbi:putative chaperon-like protein Ycf39 for quinone binding in Photosystem II [Geminocystis sp. NIES-3708]|uniref:SDR family oxidoreductase n=1 Tax=Geminocystis sp. NIES-3708 TaxID=1615909 RepID=UPI0005FC6881|nr:SDR family oxidoreductase [Geminocystis sp. NIES-3708]BAQ61757.1 putative chaperon-like protein Ycf39 for quinone binding in Photosystem II [Geminocystis sp. NIES-3708]